MLSQKTGELKNQLARHIAGEKCIALIILLYAEIVSFA